MKKLKRHDTVVVAVSVVIAMVLCGGLIYLSTPVVTATAKEELQIQEKEENEKTIEKLDELHEYLSGLDKSITESHDTLTEFYEKSSAKETENETLTKENTETITNSMTEKVTDKVTVLDNDLQTNHEIINNTENNIEKLKETIERGDLTKEQEKAVSEKFNQVSQELTKIQDEYNKAQESTTSLIDQVKDAMKKGDGDITTAMDENYKELVQKLG